MPTAQPSLTGDQQNRLRADLDAVAAHLDARRGLLHRRTALPLLYTLTGPDGPRDAVRLRAESVDPTAWPELGDAGIVLTALALGIPPLAAGDVYGYALAYRPATTRAAPAGASSSRSAVTLASSSPAAAAPGRSTAR
jgi:hypothetical protein